MWYVHFFFFLSKCISVESSLFLYNFLEYFNVMNYIQCVFKFFSYIQMVRFYFESKIRLFIFIWCQFKSETHFLMGISYIKITTQNGPSFWYHYLAQLIDTKLSGLLHSFVFKIKNPTKKKKTLKISLIVVPNF